MFSNSPPMTDKTSGRLLQTNLTQVDESHAYFELANASTINHVCVFLVGNVPFPEGYGAAVHFFWPGKGFQLLGLLSNEKPSAIFRLRGTFQGSVGSLVQDKFSSFSTADVNMQQDVTAILGLSIEPLLQIQAQILSLPKPLTAPGMDLARDPTLLAERVVKHLFNYISSFIGGGPVSPDTTIPMSVIARWYDNFLGKVRAGGIGFLERED
ncbi:hypothetical protein M413DRAFT_411155 [Hebeloma cylindrosporum]|uniref:Uncharacterized protein n=1 Tax=Hebeloma cylindrosporum TaxID=76867 RepID=A0A0C3CCV4_HEBCY|nr:hypothetical protein M413DRAFT_411155 [Hebeloma cylindrosporum h7]